MNKQNQRNIWITIIAVIITSIIVGYGVYAWQKSNLQSTEQPPNQQITDAQNQSTNLQKSTSPIITKPEKTRESTGTEEANTAKNITTKPEWTTDTDQQLGISFERPTDAVVSPVKQRQTNDGITINELIITPAGVDPTRVHFFTADTSIEQAKNIKIYEFTKIKNSEFNNVTINNYPGIRRIDHYLNNDCTNEITVIEKNNLVYGFHIAQCPTHPQGYDQIRRDIANSLRIQ